MEKDDQLPMGSPSCGRKRSVREGGRTLTWAPVSTRNLRSFKRSLTYNRRHGGWAATLVATNGCPGRLTGCFGSSRVCISEQRHRTSGGTSIT